MALSLPQFTSTDNMMIPFKLMLTSLTALLMLAVPSRAEEPIDVIEVVGQTPLGAGVDIARIASNVQATSQSP